MLNAKFYTDFLKHMTDKLGAVIAPDDRAAVSFKEMLFLQGPLASLIFSMVSSSVCPCDQHPGNPGTKQHSFLLFSSGQSKFCW